MTERMPEDRLDHYARILDGLTHLSIEASREVIAEARRARMWEDAYFIAIEASEKRVRELETELTVLSEKAVGPILSNDDARALELGRAATACVPFTAASRAGGIANVAMVHAEEEGRSGVDSFEEGWLAVARFVVAALMNEQDIEAGFGSEMARLDLEEALAAIPAKPDAEKVPCRWGSSCLNARFPGTDCPGCDPNGRCCPTPRYDASGVVYNHCVSCGAPRPTDEKPPLAAVPRVDQGAEHMGAVEFPGGDARTGVDEGDPCPETDVSVAIWLRTEELDKPYPFTHPRTRQFVAWLYRENARIKARLDALERHPRNKDGGKVVGTCR